MYNRGDNERITFDMPKILAKKVKDHARREGFSVADVMRIITKSFFQKQ